MLIFHVKIIFEFEFLTTVRCFFFKTIHCNQFLIPNKMKRSHLKVGEKDWGKFLKGWNFAWKISNHLIKSHFGEIVISGYGKIDGHCLHYHASTCWKWWIIFHVSTIHLKKNGSKWRKNATFAKHFLLWDTRLPAWASWLEENQITREELRRRYPIR